MSITEYLQAIERASRQGNATEHTYRPFFKALLEARANGDAEATNEPKREKCGAPDYVISRKKDRLTLGYVEAKDIGIDLAEVERSEQLQRYLQHLPNLLLTDYLEVRWYVRGEKGVEKRGSASLGRIGMGGKIAADAAEQAKALNLIDSFLHQKPVQINTAQDLALRLAHLTHMVRDTIVEAFANAEATQQLRDWREAFAKTLLPELDTHADREKEAKARAEFADMFAQTLAYGLFSARAAGPGGSFTREKARLLIPRTNPFLRTFFEQITGAALDDEPFAGFVDDLIQTLDHSGMDGILADFGTHSRRSDPVVHFYETFLQAYDPRLRELRGVYYTPEPVVNYIVESLDLLLKDKFAIKDGLADRSKITLTRKEGEREIREASHRVLILDPATGTATFLYRVLDFIREQFERKKNLGAWGDYVHEHLLPRLFGFELLMAPYAVAHFKIGLALAAWDKEPLFRQALSYQPHSGERINIFLTNTLEDLQEKTEQLGPLRMLSDEANAAYEIKRNKPVLVILGNPPYSGNSANKGKWISDLVRDYYHCDGKPLGERNPKWLQDDYVKFIRWAQWRIEQTGSGILAFITNHGYLDNPTFRGMRQNLMQTFDEIYVLDLHGNSKKKETDPESGAPDKNVFDIQQGVAIGIFVKLPPEAKKAVAKRGRTLGSARVSRAGEGVPPSRTSDGGATDSGAPSGGAGVGESSFRRDAETSTRDACAPQASVFHAHLHGSQRKKKYEWLEGHDVENTQWTELVPDSPDYFFIPQDKALRGEYGQGWKITDAMPLNGLGITTGNDPAFIAFNDKGATKLLAKLSASETTIKSILYRPFDERSVIYDPELLERARVDLMRHMLAGSNLGLCASRGTEVRAGWTHIFSMRQLIQLHSVSLKEVNYLFPLYLYPNGKLPDDDLFVREEPEEEKRRPNFSAAFIEDFCARLKVKFVRDGLGKPAKREVGPELIFNYAYAVFHSPGYRERYAEFLRADFPRLPITTNYELFQQLAGFGGHLVDLHARGQGDSSGISFPIKGDNVIEEVRYQPPGVVAAAVSAAGDKAKTRNPQALDTSASTAGRVWINDKQYFEGVAPEVWRFPIGGYLPAERWLKDRIGRTLGYDDTTAYPRIVNALAETGRFMREIEASITAHGGWPGAFA